MERTQVLHCMAASDVMQKEDPTAPILLMVDKFESARQLTASFCRLVGFCHHCTDPRYSEDGGPGEEGNAYLALSYVLPAVFIVCMSYCIRDPSWIYGGSLRKGWAAASFAGPSTDPMRWASHNRTYTLAMDSSNFSLPACNTQRMGVMLHPP